MGEEVFAKIKELGRINSKREELQQYCNKQFELVRVIL